MRRTIKSDYVVLGKQECAKKRQLSTHVMSEECGKLVSYWQGSGASRGAAWLCRPLDMKPHEREHDSAGGAAHRRGGHEGAESVSSGRVFSTEGHDTVAENEVTTVNDVLTSRSAAAASARHAAKAVREGMSSSRIDCLERDASMCGSLFL